MLAWSFGCQLSVSLSLTRHNICIFPGELPMLVGFALLSHTTPEGRNLSSLLRGCQPTMARNHARVFQAIVVGACGRGCSHHCRPEVCVMGNGNQGPSVAFEDLQTYANWVILFKVSITFQNRSTSWGPSLLYMSTLHTI